MAIDNSPRIRKTRDLLRRQKALETRKRVLIVSEGSKTEPLYLNAIRRAKRLPSENIRIEKGDGTDPVSVVEYAYAAMEKSGFDFDFVFCLFDRDEHLSYKDALCKARAYEGKIRRKKECRHVVFRPIPSNPAFELWFLLHFTECRALKSRHDVLRMLKQYVHDYEKSSDGMYERLKEKMQDAMLRARELNERASDGFDDTVPFTFVPEAVECLLNIRR